MADARAKMIQALTDSKDPPSVQRDRARRRAQATCNSARQVLLLSRTVQRLGERAFSVDSRLDAAVERIFFGGERHDPSRGDRAARKVRTAHAEAATLLGQLQEALDAAPSDALTRMTAQLRAALEALEQAIEDRP